MWSSSHSMTAKFPQLVILSHIYLALDTHFTDIWAHFVIAKENNHSTAIQSRGIYATKFYITLICCVKFLWKPRIISMASMHGWLNHASCMCTFEASIWEGYIVNRQTHTLQSPYKLVYTIPSCIYWFCWCILVACWLRNLLPCDMACRPPILTCRRHISLGRNFLPTLHEMHCTFLPRSTLPPLHFSHSHTSQNF